MFPARRPDRRAFTLLELCIVLALAVLLLSVAIPSLSGQLARRRLQDTFDRFDILVGEARRHSVTEGRPFVLVWAKGGVSLYPADQSDDERKKSGPAGYADFSGPANEVCELRRASSLAAQPAPVWTFWPTGNCEPVSVRYAGAAGTWEAAYSGLSGQSTISTFLAR